MIDSQLLSDRLRARFGVTLTTGPRAAAQSGVAIRVEGIAPPNGFCIEVRSSWRSVEARFVPDTFASGLMRTLRQQCQNAGRQFDLLLATFAKCGLKCIVEIDRKAIVGLDGIDGAWNRLDIACIRLTDKTDEQDAAESAASACLSLLFSLLPIEDGNLPSQVEGMPEGALTRVTVNKYERHPANRAAAIAAHGLTCKGCGFDFAAFYGPLGDGFIEVHHLTRLADMGPNYVVDPVSDLVPLCANCHQMVHRDTPPLSPENLHEILVSRQVIPAD